MSRHHHYRDDDYDDFPDEPRGHSAFFFGFVAGICSALILVTGAAMGIMTVISWGVN